MTSTVLQNMLVLSAGTTIQADARGQAIQAPTVTLLATPGQSETLTLAGNEGRLQLVLRNSSDQAVEQTTGRYISELYGAPRKAAAPAAKQSAGPRPAPRPIVIAAAPPPPPPPPPPLDQIVVIRGTTKTVETMPNRVTN
jgi:pilus assembly protein CpaB